MCHGQSILYSLITEDPKVWPSACAHSALFSLQSLFQAWQSPTLSYPSPRAVSSTQHCVQLRWKCCLLQSLHTLVCVLTPDLVTYKREWVWVEVLTETHSRPWTLNRVLFWLLGTQKLHSPAQRVAAQTRLSFTRIGVILLVVTVWILLLCSDLRWIIPCFEENLSQDIHLSLLSSVVLASWRRVHALLSGLGVTFR